MATASILGCAGYTGQETLDRVLAHPGLELLALGSDSLAGQPAAALDPRLDGSLPPFTTNAGIACSRSAKSRITGTSPHVSACGSAHSMGVGSRGVAAFLKRAAGLRVFKTLPCIRITATAA